MAFNDQDPIGNLKNKLRSLFGSSEQKDKTPQPGKARFSIWYLVLAIFLISYLQKSMFTSNAETIPYSLFKQYVEQGMVSDLVIGPDSIKGKLAGTPERDFTTHLTPVI